MQTKMNNIKTSFSIKDLENLTSIKAHTIRIWEKRYNLLHPNRSDSNIRNYSIESLQKLLNVSFLNRHGYKISKIAKLQSEDIPKLVREIASKGEQKHHALNAFKMAMLNFDQTLFFNTYNNLLQESSFKDIFYDVFIPLLNEIGILWQTNTITPAHEHFISTLIKQKILVNIEKVQNLQQHTKDNVFVLFLPLNEIHDIGLLYINYELVCSGYHSIFLGQSVPINSLIDISNQYTNITFGTYFTIKPEVDDIIDYLKNFKDTILHNTHHKLFVLGKKTKDINPKLLPKEITIYTSIKELIKTV